MLFEDSRIKRKVPKNRKPKGDEVKNKVFPHTQAKLDLYQSYLDVYLSVLQQAKGIAKINLYDIYCGNGIYDDGRPGSPIISLESIQRVNAYFDSKGWVRKPIKLTVNDGQKKRYESVKTLLSERNKGACQIDCRNLLGEAMLREVGEEIRNNRKNERNLVFIDPYGYKEIHLSTIRELMDSKTSEIYLFLPIAQMHRFSQTAVQKRVNNTSYEPLRRFIKEFLPDYDFNQRPTAERVFQFINAITTALSFGGTYHSCSHYIQRDRAGNYYAIFFITSNLYGLDKMLNAKWSNDKVNGQGYRMSSNVPVNQLSLELQQVSEEDREKIRHLNHLSTLLTDYFVDGQPRTNKDLYKFILGHGYLSKHATPILKEMCSAGKVRYTSCTGANGFPTYLNWEAYNLPDPKYFIQNITL